MGSLQRGNRALRDRDARSGRVPRLAARRVGDRDRDLHDVRRRHAARVVRGARAGSRVAAARALSRGARPREAVDLAGRADRRSLVERPRERDDRAGSRRRGGHRRGAGRARLRNEGAPVVVARAGRGGRDLLQSLRLASPRVRVDARHEPDQGVYQGVEGDRSRSVIVRLRCLAVARDRRVRRRSGHAPLGRRVAVCVARADDARGRAQPRAVRHRRRADRRDRAVAGRRLLLTRARDAARAAGGLVTTDDLARRGAGRRGRAASLRPPDRSAHAHDGLARPGADARRAPPALRRFRVVQLRGRRSARRSFLGWARRSVSARDLGRVSLHRARARRLAREARRPRREHGAGRARQRTRSSPRAHAAVALALCGQRLPALGQALSRRRSPRSPAAGPGAVESARAL